MDRSSTRVFTRTLAHRAVKDIKKDGFRQLRHYVDMCAILSGGTMQQSFFERAQNLLEKADSQYYSLVQRMVNTVEEEHLCTVGVNLGFNGIVYGASKLKKRAEETGEKIAPITVAMGDDPGLEDAVTQGERMGSYVWVLHGAGGLDAPAALAKAHPESAFFLTMDPAEVDENAAAVLGRRENLVTLLTLEKPEMDEAAHSAARRLREVGLFYGFVVCLDDDTAPQAVQSEWLEVLSEEALFCVCSRREGMSEECSERLKQAIYRSRTVSGVPVLLLDWENDVRVLNEHVSPNAVLGCRLPAEASVPLRV